MRLWSGYSAYQYANPATPRGSNGLPLDIVVRGGKLYVNGVNVVTADVQASNGVITSLTPS